ncbi:MAG TPA: POTRA domain-containing protein, partial [Fontimonas sp.]
MKSCLAGVALLCGVFAGPLAAQDAVAGTTVPRIVEIAYRGNEVTREKVLQRELVIAVGDPADPERIERSRQGLLDLGLFSAASVEQQPLDGGVRVVFVLRERYFLLPTPRFDAKSDGRYSYGAQLIWNNVGGRNHTMRIYAERENAEREGVGTETQYAARYYAPFVFDSRYNLTLSSSYAERPVRREAVDFEESFRNASFSVSRTFSDGAASQGLTVGGGLGFRQQRTRGIDALPAYGSAIVPTVFVNERDFHNRIYSDVGEITSLAV